MGALFIWGQRAMFKKTIYIINHYDWKNHKIWQFTTAFPFLGNGIEWNGVVKLKVFLGLLKILWAIIQRYIIRCSRHESIKPTRF